MASGPKAVGGLTFQPSVVLHFMDYDTAALPSSVADSSFMLGAMDASGNQWASAFYSTDGGRPTTTARAQRTDAALEETTGTAGETLRATFSSMDANGFTVNFGTNTTLQVETNSTTVIFDTFLKFDLSSVTNMSGAKLRIFAAMSGSGSAGTSPRHND